MPVVQIFLFFGEMQGLAKFSCIYFKKRFLRAELVFYKEVKIEARKVCIEKHLLDLIYKNSNFFSKAVLKSSLLPSKNSLFYGTPVGANILGIWWLIVKYI